MSSRRPRRFESHASDRSTTAHCSSETCQIGGIDALVHQPSDGGERGPDTPQRIYPTEPGFGLGSSDAGGIDRATS